MYLSRRETPPRELLSEKNLSIIGIPRLFHAYEVEDFKGDSETKRIITRYVENIHLMFEDCVNLTFYGSNGNGKTFLTSLILKNAYRYRYSAKRITFSSYIGLNFSKSKSEKDWMDIHHAHECEFLVIDELGKEVDLKSGANTSLLEELLKYREEKGLPTIICTNLPLEDLEARYGSTIGSLISQSVLLKMTGEDVRYDMFQQRKAVSVLYDEGVEE